MKTEDLILIGGIGYLALTSLKKADDKFSDSEALGQDMNSIIANPNAVPTETEEGWDESVYIPDKEESDLNEDEVLLRDYDDETGEVTTYKVPRDELTPYQKTAIGANRYTIIDDTLKPTWIPRNNKYIDTIKNIGNSALNILNPTDSFLYSGYKYASTPTTKTIKSGDSSTSYKGTPLQIAIGSSLDWAKNKFKKQEPDLPAAAKYAIEQASISMKAISATTKSIKSSSSSGSSSSGSSSSGSSSSGSKVVTSKSGVTVNASSGFQSLMKKYNL